MSYSPTHDLFLVNPSLSEQLDNGKRYINIDYATLEEYDFEYANKALNNPELITALNDVATELAGSPKNVRLVNIPISTPIHALRSEHNYKIIQVEGTVILRSGILSRPKVIMFECPACHALNPVEQDEQWLKTPEYCINCDNRKNFKKSYKDTDFDDYQWIQLQELNENTESSRAPSKIKVLLKNSFVESCEVGDIVKITCIPKVLEKSSRSVDLEMKTYLECIGIVNVNQQQSSSLSEEDKTRFHELSKRDDFIDLMINSTAPTLYGLREEKIFMDLQQVGGVEKYVDGEFKRGSIHGWFPGDPGEGKSVCLDWSARISPRGINAGGRGATAAGLTASVRHDKDLGEWVLDAGALVLADGGHVSIDEIEKMRDEDRENIHTAMEQQYVSINKAGINAKLITRTSILGASNPTSGTWNPYLSIGENIDNLPPALQTRFDCIFIVINDRGWEEEEKRVDHVADVHRDNLKNDVDIISEDDLKKYFSYARTFKPKITESAMTRLKSLYKVLFEAGKAQENKIVMITLRQLEGLIRLTEASAKLHLRDECTVEDADVAIRVFKASMFKTLLDRETGVPDVSQLYKSSGKAKSKKDRYRVIREMVKGYVETYDCGGIEETKLLELLAKRNLKMFEASGLIEEMIDMNPPMLYRNGGMICIA